MTSKYDGRDALFVHWKVLVVFGLAFWPIGIAAGIGAVLYFDGAIVAHLRVGDRAVTGSAVLLGISLAAVVLRAMAL